MIRWWLAGIVVFISCFSLANAYDLFNPDDVNYVRSLNLQIRQFVELAEIRGLSQQEIADLINLARERKEILLILLESRHFDIELFRSLLFTREEILNLPEFVRVYVESWVERRGFVEIYHWDSFDEGIGSEMIYQLHPRGQSDLDEIIDGEESQFYRLFFDEELYSFEFGDNAAVEGYEIDENIIISNAEIDSQGSGASVRHLGEQKVAVILVGFNNLPFDFSDESEINPSNFEELQVMLGDVSVFFQQASQARTDVNFEVFGPYELSIPFTCRYRSIMRWALRYFRTNVENYRDYRRFVFIFMEPPRGSIPENEVRNCEGWAGLGTIGGRRSYSWIKFLYMKPETINHELGHNFGLYHANLLNCGEQSILRRLRSCTSQEYQDYDDMMGIGVYEAFPNIILRKKLYWVDPEEITFVDSTGNYEISSRELNTGLPKALMIRWIGRFNYYLEYGDYHGQQNVLIMHLPWRRTGGETQIIRFSPLPADQRGPGRMLHLGQTYYDPVREFTITLIRADDESAEIEVNFEPPEGGAASIDTSAIFVRGDVNQDGSIDISDAVFILHYLFRGGETPRCIDAADADDDGQIALGDVIVILNYLFRNGERLAPPFLDHENVLSPSQDPTRDLLFC